MEDALNALMALMLLAPFAEGVLLYVRNKR
jgi:hypothetical protein